MLQNGYWVFSFYNLLWIFFIYSFLGWMMEVIFCSVNTGKFVNRGFLNGPVCPIYGAGALIIILALRPVDQSVLLLFVTSALVASLLELLTGYVLFELFKTRWWDYSDKPFNIGGYICLSMSLLWGIAGILLMRVLHPAVSTLVDLVPSTLGIVLLVVFGILFIADLVVTTVAVNKLNRDLGEMTKIAEGLHRQSEVLAKGLGNTAIHVAAKAEEGKDRINENVACGKEKMLSSLEGQRERLDAGVDAGRSAVRGMVDHGRSWVSEETVEARQRMAKAYERLSQRPRRLQRRIFYAFPKMKSPRYEEALRYLKKMYESDKKKSAQNADLNNKKSGKKNDD